MRYLISQYRRLVWVQSCLECVCVCVCVLLEAWQHMTALWIDCRTAHAQMEHMCRFCPAGRCTARTKRTKKIERALRLCHVLPKPNDVAMSGCTSLSTDVTPFPACSCFHSGFRFAICMNWVEGLACCTRLHWNHSSWKDIDIEILLEQTTCGSKDVTSVYCKDLQGHNVASPCLSSFGLGFDNLRTFHYIVLHCTVLARESMGVHGFLGSLLWIIRAICWALCVPGPRMLSSRASRILKDFKTFLDSYRCTNVPHWFQKDLW